MRSKQKQVQRKQKKDPRFEKFFISSAAFYRSYNLQTYQPNEVGTFSVNQDGQVVDINSTHFPDIIDLNTVRFPIDLNSGFDNYYKSKSDETFAESKSDTLPLYQKLLHWICSTNFDIRNVDIVGRRGIFKILGYTLFDYHRGPWSFRVCKYQDKLYIQEVPPDTAAPCEPTEQQYRYMYWGRQFERHVTRQPDHIKACYSMVQSRIGKFSMLLGCEIDCIRTLNDGGPPELIELKTSTEKAQYNKIAFSWMQSFLSGVDKLIYGLRDENGFVHSIDEQEVKAVPLRCRGRWSGEAMLGLVSAVLSWVYFRVEEGASGLLAYKGGDIVLSRSGGHFLPGWYIDYVEKLNVVH